MTPARAVRATLVGLALGVLLTQFGFTLMRVTGSSMDPNLREGEVLLVLRPPLLALSDLLAGRAPGERLAERGAVVVLPDPRAEGGPLGVGRPLIVKRVVGLPGDTVALARGRVLVDGEELSEPWLDPAHRGASTMRPRAVPPGALFLLGDNRLPLASSDSRSFGPQPVTALRGRAVAELRLPWGEAGPRSPLAPLP